ncbi:trypsin-like peptidase domain-containing protein [Vibrio sp. D404a]|uniref:S1 family peptidase n=1 Tax=unclassified Vibrio TaxID=2614977 RepID=UPI0025536BF7|nr:MULTISPECIES: serine protease [unclassified Vibrio]MDK9740247.1 trypsin-like peptidase domain-containing protein [Vibrio sp. D404a]MDK9799795.1 trypsin-like peptidase domain-containing protein [Vibrio sp. D449a]
MAKMSRSNLGYPVRLVRSDGGSGTGFYVFKDNFIYLVTAKHVFFHDSGALKGDSCLARSYSEDWVEDDYTELKLNLDYLLKNGSLKAHSTQDVCAIKLAVSAGGQVYPLGMAGREVEILNKNQYGVVHIDHASCPKRFDEVELANDVFMMGYPSSIGTLAEQFNREMPLLRKGIVAGKWNEKKSIIVECPSYPGNSGGPVIELDYVENKPCYKLIGVVSELIPVDEHWRKQQVHADAQWARVAHSGYSAVVAYDFVEELMD